MISGTYTMVLDCDVCNDDEYEYTEHTAAQAARAARADGWRVNVVQGKCTCPGCIRVPRGGQDEAVLIALEDATVDFSEDKDGVSRLASAEMVAAATASKAGVSNAIIAVLSSLDRLRDWGFCKYVGDGLWDCTDEGTDLYLLRMSEQARA